MASSLKNADRYYLVTEDEYKRLAVKKSPIEPVLNSAIKSAKDGAERLTRASEIEEPPALKAIRYERLVDRYFNDLSRLPPNRSRRSPLDEAREEEQTRATPDRAARPKLGQFTPASGERSQIPVRETKSLPRRVLPPLPSWDSDDEDEEAIARAERVKARESLIEDSKILPNKKLRSRLVSPIERPKSRWKTLDRPARR